MHTLNKIFHKSENIFLGYNLIQEKATGTTKNYFHEIQKIKNRLDTACFISILIHYWDSYLDNV